MLIVPSTEYRIPVHTWTVVIVQSPVMTPPTWSQAAARAPGLSARTDANNPPRTMETTIRRLRAAPLRPATSDKGRPPKIALSDTRKATTSGHNARAIPGRFINRLPRDYLSRYAPVLTRENNPFLWRDYYYSFVNMEIVENCANRSKIATEDWNSPTAKGLRDRRGARSDDLLLQDLLHAHGRLLRAPLVLGSDPVAARVAHDRVG